MGSSIPLRSGMGSSHHRETIVYSSLGPIQKERQLFEKRMEEERYKGGWRKMEKKF